MVSKPPWREGGCMIHVIDLVRTDHLDLPILIEDGVGTGKLI